LEIRALLRRCKPGDLIVILMMGLLALFLSALLPKRIITSGDVVFIQSGSQLVGRYSLNHDRVISVNGPLGESRIQIKAGKVSILSSPCPNHYCVKMGQTGAGCSALVCVPNEIIVRIGGDDQGKVDAISR
jgi:hypothetical protein